MEALKPGPAPLSRESTRVLLDLDGVLVDFLTGYFTLHPKYVRPEPWPPGIWDIAEALPGSKASMEGLTESFWAELPWMPDGREILCILEQEFRVDNICILSSCHVEDVGAACGGKIRWIYTHLPRYAERYLFGPDKRFCGHRDSLLIDDKDENVEEFIKAGGRAILIPRPWNKAHTRAGVNMASYIRGQIDAQKDPLTRIR